MIVSEERRVLGRPQDAFVDLNAVRRQSEAASEGSPDQRGSVTGSPFRPGSRGSRGERGLQGQEPAVSRPLTPSDSARRLFSLNVRDQALTLTLTLTLALTLTLTLTLTRHDLCDGGQARLGRLDDALQGGRRAHRR